MAILIEKPEQLAMEEDSELQGIGEESVVCSEPTAASYYYGVEILGGLLTALSLQHKGIWTCIGPKELAKLFDQSSEARQKVFRRIRVELALPA